MASAVIMASFIAFGTEAADQRSKESALQELMELTKWDSLATQMVEQMMPTVVNEVRMAVPDLPERGYQIFEEELRKGFEHRMPDFSTAFIQIYAKRFTLSEIEYLTQFYRTPIGRKFVEELPAITLEATEFGQNLGAEVGALAGEIAYERMVKEGLVQ
ncbi:MAG: DUF2059 domain-containing protein [Proteobacteria bacterium]|nr:DUF2059 domain-containing protein [Pseudomonadota bacterium]